MNEETVSLFEQMNRELDKLSDALNEVIKSEEKMQETLIEMQKEIAQNGVSFEDASKALGNS
nr:MAG TPA: DNA-binding protein [Caudoviricetes sp.]